MRVPGPLSTSTDNAPVTIAVNASARVEAESARYAQPPSGSDGSAQVSQSAAGVSSHGELQLPRALQLMWAALFSRDNLHGIQHHELHHRFSFVADRELPALARFLARESEDADAARA